MKLLSVADANGMSLELGAFQLNRTALRALHVDPEQDLHPTDPPAGLFRFPQPLRLQNASLAWTGFRFLPV